MRFLPLAALVLLGSAPQDPPVDRSPHGLALSADGRWALTANAGSHSVSLVELDSRKIAAEVAVGKRPFAIAWSGRRAVVTNLRDDSVTVLDVEPPRLEFAGDVSVGDEPRGVAIDGDRAFVALSGDDAIAVVDLAARKVVARAAVGDEPWHVALTPDRRRLAVTCALSMDVRVLDAAKLEPLHTVRMRGHNLRQVAVSPDGAWAYACNIAERGAGTTKQNIDRGWVLGNRLSRVPLREDGPREAIAIDVRGEASADADGVAVSPDGQQLAVACGGSHELLLLRQPLPFVATGGPGDHIDPALRRDAKRFRRVVLGGRPVAAAFTPDGRSVVVTNHLRNLLQVVDVEKGEVARLIYLGGAEMAERSPARRGEWAFYDASRSFHQWYSCHTCHTDGHTNGASFDTLNDGAYGSAKKTLSLRGIARTAPYTWHGWQKELSAAVEHSLTTTLQGDPPKKEDVDALVAFLSTLDFAPPRPAADAEAVKRGEAVFKAKGCAACHAPPDYTTALVHEVGLEDAKDKYRGFNPPPLRGVGTRGPWLHDGRAKSLEEVLQKHHAPSRVTGKEDLTDAELRDLVAFLKSI